MTETSDVTGTGDVTAGYEALRRAVGAVRLERDVIRASGPDAVVFLQGQASQDLAALPVGQTTWSLVLQPQGKIDALVRVTREGDDAFLLDVDGGGGPALLARLNRFKLRTKIVFDPLDWRCVGIRGPGSVNVRPHLASIVAAGAVVVDASWPGLPGFDILGEDPPVPAGVPLVDPAAYDAARIEAGVPRAGAELTERTIPAEAGLVERTVSFTKGCYTGQELVARIDSRGSNVARHLRGLRLSGFALPGSSLEVDGKQVGMVSSVAQSPALGWVALGYVARSVEVAASLTVVDPAGTRTGEGRVELLPLVS